VAAFTDGGGGGGEGGGGGSGGGWFGGGDEDTSTWKDYGVFGDAGGDSKQTWKKESWIADNVPGYTRECWRDRECRRTLLAQALDIWIRAKARDPRSDIWRSIASGRTRGLIRRYGEQAIQTAELERARTMATQPQQRQLPTLPPSTGKEPAWLRLLRIALEQVQRYRQQQAEREQQRAQRRALKMSLSDTIGDVIGSVTTAGAQILPTILRQRAQDQAVRSQLRLARLGFAGGGSMSGVPLAAGGAGGLLAALLGEQGAMEAPDLLESLGMATGLEGAIEREATFYVPTASGVRAVPEIQARNPVTGRINTWKNMGRPVLFSGDLATCKRVNKISARVGRVARRRGLVPRRRRG